MNDHGRLFPFQKLSSLLVDSAGSLTKVTSYFTDFQFEVNETSEILSKMQNLLDTSSVLLDQVAFENVTVSQLLEYFDWIQEGRKEFYELFGGFQKLESILLHLVEIIEEEFQKNEDAEFKTKVSILFDQLERISDVLVETKPITKSVKRVFDTAIEFNEIFKEHMNSLDIEIENCFKVCLEIQESHFSSPVRHNKPIYTLDELLTMLSSKQTSRESIELPLSSSIERNLHAQFLELEESVSLIEMSLVTVLQQRVDNFGNPSISNVEYLRRLLQNKYEELFKKYEFLKNEVHDLKYVLVDQKWEIVFDNLNDELRSILKDIEKLVDKIENNGISEEIRGKYRHQLGRKSEIVDKTFGIIYKALESSLLSERIATITNEKANTWLILKEKCEHLFPDDEDTIDELTISTNLASLKLTDAPSEKPGSNRSSIGALLFKKMNIKPVLIQDENNQLDNPFYDSDEKGDKYTGLNLNLVPKLVFEPRERIIPDQNELFKYYLNKKTNIPGGDGLPHKKSILFDFNPNWKLKPHHQLRPPTIITRCN